MSEITPPEDFSGKLDKVLDCELFKSLSEPLRCKILKVVALGGPMDISTIAKNFTQDRSVISRHLHQMCDAGILLSEKQARSRVFCVNGVGFLQKLEEMTATVRFLLSCSCDEMK
jgi:predicted transcriptional regulator